MNRNHRFSTKIKLLALLLSLSVSPLLSPSGNASGAATKAPAPQTQSAANPNLAGQWKLNKDQSDDPRQKMQQAMGGNGQGGGRGGEGGGGRRGGGQGQGGGQGGGMMNDLAQLSIVQTDTSVKVSNASGRVLAAYPEDTQAAKPAANGGNADDDLREPAPPVAKWQGSQLVATMQGRRGGTTTRTYELSSDGRQLIVTTKMQNPRFTQPVTFRLVYDPAKATSGSSQ
ncbi:MAG: hypothetical protein WAK91_08650 [Candidatus Acidiferrales bacterium]